MKKLSVIAFLLVALFLGWSNVSHAQCTPPFLNFVSCFRSSTDPSIQTYIATDVVNILESIGGFLLVIAGILAGIVIIVSGVMWMTAGSNPARVGAAKSIFKNGVIGALIFFGAGIIINTIALLALDPFGFFS